MVNTKKMALVAILAIMGSVTSALAVPALIGEVSAQGNMTVDMTGNYTEKVGNMTAEAGNISGFAVPP